MRILWESSHPKICSGAHIKSSWGEKLTLVKHSKPPQACQIWFDGGSCTCWGGSPPLRAQFNYIRAQLLEKESNNNAVYISLLLDEYTRLLHHCFIGKVFGGTEQHQGCSFFTTLTINLHRTCFVLFLKTVVQYWVPSLFIVRIMSTKGNEPLMNSSRIFAQW
jgi:hypothetical protein